MPFDRYHRAPPPPGWQCVPLGKVGEIVSGVTLGRRLGGSRTRRVPYLRVANVKDAHLDLSDVYEIEASEEEIERLRLRVGDLLLTEGGDADKLGRGTLWRGELPLCIHQNHIFRARFDPEEFWPEFIAAEIASPYGKAYFLAHAKQTTGIATINQRVLAGFPLIAPSLTKQQRIAAILQNQMAAVERARAAAEARSEAVNALEGGYIRAIFEAPHARSWSTVRLRDIARVQGGYAFESKSFSRDGIRLLRNANVSQGFLEWSDEVRLPWNRRSEFILYEMCEGDIVLSLDRPVVKGGLKVARVVTADLPCLLLQRVGRFQFRAEVDSDFVYAFLRSPRFVNAISGHDYSLGVPHISPTQVEAVEMPLPALDEQKRVAAELRGRGEQVRGLQDAIFAEMTAINQLSSALLHRAFP